MPSMSISPSNHKRARQLPPLVVIVGETASGKSSLAIELARQVDGEIISADSRMIYQDMDIGTAKPTSDERKRAPHHLIDIVSPDQKFNVAQFKRLALETIADVRSRDRVPILVGGTGLYIDSVIFDYKFRTKYGSKIDSSLHGMDTDELRKLCLDLGYNECARENNRRYLIKRLSQGMEPGNDRASLIGNIILIGVKLDRRELRQRIQRRVEVMFRRGLRKEVEGLARRYGWDSEALTAIGYREFKPYFEGKISMSEVKRKIVSNTLQYAKRQRTWFKRNPKIRWFADLEEAKHYVVSRIKEQQL